MATAVHDFLVAAGFDPAGDEHLRSTGQRVAEAWTEDLLDGQGRSPEGALGEAFAAESSELVVIKDLSFVSTCPHHLLPYRGRAGIAYLPAGRAVGFSNLVALLDVLAHRLTLQEWLVRDVVRSLERVLEPRGAACVVDGVPMCVVARGIKRECSVVTSAFSGVFEEDAGLRAEILGQMGFAPDGEASKG
jgi:GTP cyclohydrolase I